MAVAWSVHWVSFLFYFLSHSDLHLVPFTALRTRSYLHSTTSVYYFTAHASGGSDRANDVSNVQFQYFI
ncbi:hypothetical protein XELAEV_18033457mg [Xenopus laevis]|uniref:Uncharacterized protein n=1 Tax=Xenopus laevis TaxID=8355 RepID=A0A974HE13_XENLA|nr:hypothetical protein XELAEV_18033457mg [Xenopus laevis]